MAFWFAKREPKEKSLVSTFFEHIHGKTVCKLTRVTFYDRSICYETSVAFSFVVLFKRGRSLVIVLSPSNICRPLKKSDCPQVAPRVFCNVNGGNRIQTGFL